MMNRAGGQQQADTADEEGTQQRKLWWKRIADGIIEDEFGFDDLEWGWNDATSVQPLIQAQIDDLNLRNGSTFINEVRDVRGLNTVDGGDDPLIYLVTGPVPLAHAVEEALKPPAPVPAALAAHQMGAPGASGNEDEHPEQPTNSENGPKSAHAPNVVVPDAASKLAKATDAISADRPLVRRAIVSAKRKIAKALRATGDDVAGQVESQLKRFGKVAPVDDSSIGPTLAAQIAKEVRLDELADLDITDEMFSVAFDSGEAGLAKVGVAKTDDLVNRVNQRAVDWSSKRAGELVSVQGPDNIVASTREMIGQVIAKGLQDNIGSRAIADAVQDSTAFSADRAQLIASTEIRRANSEGALNGFREARDIGVKVKKTWDTAGDDLVDEDICQPNEDVGPIDLEAEFPSGDDTPPGHPRCRCSLGAQVEDDSDTDADPEDGE
jgi:hypothetical protein